MSEHQSLPTELFAVTKQSSVLKLLVVDVKQFPGYTLLKTELPDELKSDADAIFFHQTYYKTVKVDNKGYLQNSPIVMRTEGEATACAIRNIDHAIEQKKAELEQLRKAKAHLDPSRSKLVKQGRIALGDLRNTKDNLVSNDSDL